MKQLIVRKFIVIALLMQYSFSQFASAEDKLPPILDYYPNCSYQVIETASSKVDTERDYEVEVVTDLLLNLREQAKSAGADALILKKSRLTEKKRKRFTLFKGNKLFYLSYEADFIKKCKESQTKNKKVTPFDQNGIKTFGRELKKYKFQLKLPKKAQLNRPQIINTEVSVISGMYGIKIGSNYQQVLDYFGSPSVELVIEPDEFIVGYGRRHWLFFKENKLVNIQSNSPLLSQELINLIPLRDFFDQFSWEINNKFQSGTSLAEVQSALNIKTPLNRDNQLIVSEQGNILVLNFLYGKNLNTGQKSYNLNDFSLRSEMYKPYIKSTVKLDHPYYKIMSNVYKRLLKEQEVDWQSISHKLGEPFGRITLTANSQINIYNSHLFVKLSHSNLSAFYFVEKTMRSDIHISLSDNHWNLGPFIQKKSVSQLSEFIPETAFQSGDVIDIESDSYNLTLSFDEINGKASLYEAKIFLY